MSFFSNIFDLTLKAKYSKLLCLSQAISATGKVEVTDRAMAKLAVILSNKQAAYDPVIQDFKSRLSEVRTCGDLVEFWCKENDYPLDKLVHEAIGYDTETYRKWAERKLYML